jgi:hypothetical protein
MCCQIAAVDPWHAQFEQVKVATDDFAAQSQLSDQ